MSIDFKYKQATFTSEPVNTQVAAFNNPKLPGSIVEKIVEEFNRSNKHLRVVPGTEVYIPILPPFHKNHSDLLSREDFVPQKPVEIKEELPPVEEPKPEPQVTREVKPTEAEPEPKPEPAKPEPDPEDNKPPVKKLGALSVRLYPYTFARPNETIEAVIRLYNDMSVSRQVIDKLVYEFSRINVESLPPKLGQTVQVPVLLPFCYRHENNHKIFTDE